MSDVFVPTSWEPRKLTLDQENKRHSYDDIIMGFYGKAFDNGLQAKVQAYLIFSQSEFRAFWTISF